MILALNLTKHLSFMVSLALSAFTCFLDYHINRLWGTGVKFGQASVFHCYACSMIWRVILYCSYYY